MNEILLSAGCLMLAAIVVMQELQILGLREEQARASGQVEGLRTQVRELDTRLANNDLKLRDKIDRYVLMRTDFGYVAGFGTKTYDCEGNIIGYASPEYTEKRGEALRLTPSRVADIARQLGTNNYIVEPVEVDHD
jgi:hypothetical protein